MVDWSQYDTDQIRNGFDGAGQRLAPQFVDDYYRTLGVEICLSCSNISEKVKTLMLKKQQMARGKKEDVKVSDKPVFKLKKMFQNITLTGSRKYFNDSNLTQEDAIMLIVKHPKGVELFETVPSDWEELVEKSKESENTIEIDGSAYSAEQVSSALLALEIDVVDGSIDELKKLIEGLDPEKTSELKEVLITA